jgi:hypothetical protein
MPSLFQLWWFIVILECVVIIATSLLLAVLIDEARAERALAAQDRPTRNSRFLEPRSSRP